MFGERSQDVICESIGVRTGTGTDLLFHKCFDIFGQGDCDGNGICSGCRGVNLGS